MTCFFSRSLFSSFNIFAPALVDGGGGGSSVPRCVTRFQTLRCADIYARGARLRVALHGEAEIFSCLSAAPHNVSHAILITAGDTTAARRRIYNSSIRRAKTLLSFAFFWGTFYSRGAAGRALHLIVFFFGISSGGRRDALRDTEGTFTLDTRGNAMQIYRRNTSRLPRPLLLLFRRFIYDLILF